MADTDPDTDAGGVVVDAVGGGGVAGQTGSIHAVPHGVGSPL